MRFFWLIIAALFVVLPTQAQDDVTPMRILVISIDGARPDAIQIADAPNLQTLAAEGAVDWQARTIMPSVTLPAHTSMFTGLTPTEHRIFHNGYVDQRFDIPTFLSITHAAEIPTAMIVGKQKLVQLHYPEDIPYDFAREGDRSVIDATIEHLEEGAQVVFVHLPNTDYFFGHLTGWMSPTYLYELGNTDREIGRLLQALDDLDLREHTLIIITADHGGHDGVHGSQMREDLLIPMIINGVGVEARTVLRETSNTQVAATVLYALGLDIPDDMAAPIMAIFPESD